MGNVGRRQAGVGSMQSYYLLGRCMIRFPTRVPMSQFRCRLAPPFHDSTAGIASRSGLHAKRVRDVWRPSILGGPKGTSQKRTCRSRLPLRGGTRGGTRGLVVMNLRSSANPNERPIIGLMLRPDGVRIQPNGYGWAGANAGKRSLQAPGFKPVLAEVRFTETTRAEGSREGRAQRTQSSYGLNATQITVAGYPKATCEALWSRDDTKGSHPCSVAAHTVPAVLRLLLALPQSVCGAIRANRWPACPTGTPDL